MRLEAFHTCHIWQFVGYALVTVDAGFFAAGKCVRVLLGSARTLPGEIHVFEFVAIATFQRIVCLESVPFMLR